MFEDDVAPMESAINNALQSSETLQFMLFDRLRARGFIRKAVGTSYMQLNQLAQLMCEKLQPYGIDMPLRKPGLQLDERLFVGDINYEWCKNTFATLISRMKGRQDDIGESTLLMQVHHDDKRITKVFFPGSFKPLCVGMGCVDPTSTSRTTMPTCDVMERVHPKCKYSCIMCI